MHIRSVIAIAMVVSAAVFIGANLPSITKDAVECSTLEASDQNPPQLSIDSNPHAVLTEAFEKSGYGVQDSADLATRAYKRLRGEPVEAFVRQQDVVDGAVLLDPDSNPHAILAEMFADNGHSLERAVDVATWMVRRIRGEQIDFEASTMQTGTDCAAFKLTFIYCDPPLKKRTVMWVNALCWEPVRSCFVFQAACPLGQIRNALLPTTCVDGISCAWVNDAAVASNSFVSCDMLDVVDCDCLEFVDCASLVSLCCPALSCAGCPDCD